MWHEFVYSQADIDHSGVFAAQLRPGGEAAAAAATATMSREEKICNAMPRPLLRPEGMMSWALRTDMRLAASLCVHRREE